MDKRQWIGAIAVGVLAGGLLAAPASAASATHYRNCTALQKAYKHGVAKKGARDKVSGHTKPVTTFKVNNAVYAANKGLDRDKDGIACEKR
jgi:hypothetical protein